MRCNSYGINNYSTEVSESFVGKYEILYYSELKGRDRKCIHSKLIIRCDGQVDFYNNIKKNIEDAEYSYHGICNIDENIIYIHLKNEFSNEIATIYFIKSVGDLNRFIGLFIALLSNFDPVCIKIACFKENLYLKGVNENLLKEIMTSSNINWENSILIIE